jgi:hypothetical protein
MKTNKLRMELEMRIPRAAVKGLLAAGYLITVYDGEEDTLVRSSDAKAILKATRTTDEDYLLASTASRNDAGWVRFIYGNEGPDVINDYTVNLEDALKGANAIANRYM